MRQESSFSRSSTRGTTELKITTEDLGFAVAPGESIQEELSARGESLGELASALNMPEAQVSRILQGDLELSDQLAERLAVHFGTSAALWKNLEIQYRTALANNAPRLTVQGIVEKSSQSNGRIALRIPKSLHGRVAQLAKQEGVSMNQLLVALLAEGVTRHEAGAGG